MRLVVIFAVFLHIIVNTSLASSNVNVAKKDSNVTKKSSTNYPTYGDWSVIDIQNQSFISQVLTTTDKDGKKHFLAEYRIGYLQPGSNMQMFLVTPLGVNIISGLSLVADGTAVLRTGYLTCGNMGCAAITDINKEIVNNMIAAKKVSVNFTFYNIAKPVELTVSTKGLKDAISKITAPKINPKANNTSKKK